MISFSNTALYDPEILQRTASHELHKNYLSETRILTFNSTPTILQFAIIVRTNKSRMTNLHNSGRGTRSSDNSYARKNEHHQTRPHQHMIDAQQFFIFRRFSDTRHQHLPLNHLEFAPGVGPLTIPKIRFARATVHPRSSPPR